MITKAPADLPLTLIDLAETLRREYEYASRKEYFLLVAPISRGRFCAIEKHDIETAMQMVDESTDIHKLMSNEYFCRVLEVIANGE